MDRIKPAKFAHALCSHGRRPWLVLERCRSAGSGPARASSSEPAAKDAALEASMPQAPSSSSVDCIGTSMDVTCSVSADPQSMPLAKAEASVSGVAATDTEGLAESRGAKTLSILLLVSPFFFWGTSMVGMKVRHRASMAERHMCCGLVRYKLATDYSLSQVHFSHQHILIS